MVKGQNWGAEGDGDEPESIPRKREGRKEGGRNRKEEEAALQRESCEERKRSIKARSA